MVLGCDCAKSLELSREEIARYSRHLILPEVGMDGQKKLKAASVLMIGTGGLGAPVALYLAAAGVGRIGLVDFDVVDASNLQRQVLFSTADIGRPKTQAAKERLQGINPHIQIDIHEGRFSSENALQIIAGYDVVIDGTDNFPTRYLTNDACVILKKPNVYGSIYRFEGQATVFDPRQEATPAGPGPCYRCLYPDPPPPGMVPSCAEGGVLGILPAAIGSIQATEAVKIILGVGKSLVGRLVRYNAMDMTFKEYKLRRDKTCPICGDAPTIKALIDYEQFCGIRGEESHTVIRQQPEALPEITVRELKAKLERGEDFQLLDVREPFEHKLCSLKQAKLIPLGQVMQRLGELDKSKPIVVHCKLGGRSAKAVDALREAGFAATNVKGGIIAWAKEIDPTMAQY